MKRVLLGLALLGLAAACKATANVADTSTEACTSECEMTLSLIHI